MPALLMPADPPARTWIKFTEGMFYQLGLTVALNPWRTICTSVPMALLLFAGVFAPTSTYEARSEYLWVPQDSLAFETLNFVEETFTTSMFNSILCKPSKAAPRPFLSKATFDTLWEVDHEVRAIELADGRTFEDICVKVGPSCVRGGPLGFWASRQAYASSVGSDEDVRLAVSQSTYASGFPVSRPMTFGFYEEALDGSIASVPGGLLVYQINSDLVTQKDTEGWERAFLAVAGVKGAPSQPVLRQARPGIYLVPYGYRSLDAELTRIVTIDVPLVVVEYVVMFLFVAAVLSWRQPRTKALLALGCIASILLSTMAGYGVCAACGIPLTQLVFILPFILVGIGVDDGFMIVAAYRRLHYPKEAGEQPGVEKPLEGGGAVDGQDKSLPRVGSIAEAEFAAAERMARALAECGVSILYTTVTDCVAFSLGAAGSIPAIKYFCAYAAVAVALDFAFQVTLFVAVFTVDERRHAERGGSRAMPSKQGGPTEVEAEGTAEKAEKAAPRTPPAAAAPAAATAAAGSGGGSGSGGWLLPEYSWRRHVGLVTGPSGARAVLLLFAAFVAFNGWALTNLDNDFQPKQVTPDDSYCREYYAEASEVGLFWDRQFPYQVIFREVDWGSPQVQADALELLTQDLAQDTPRTRGPLDFWLQAFLPWAAARPELAQYLNAQGHFDAAQSEEARDAFQSGVQTFLTTTPNDRFRLDVALSTGASGASGGKGAVFACKASLYHFRVATSEDKAKAMSRAYETCEKSPFTTAKATPYSQPYIFITQFMVIAPETGTNLLLSITAVLLISFPVLQDARAVLAVLVGVAAVDVDLLGLMWVWGLDLNSITMISLVMAIGLVVDYLAHIAHYFVHGKSSGFQEASPRERMVCALEDVGGAVLIGGLTTLVGVMPLAFASSFIYRVFFSLFLTIVVLGLVHGFVVVPTLLVLGQDPGTQRAVLCLSAKGAPSNGDSDVEATGGALKKGGLWNETKEDS